MKNLVPLLLFFVFLGSCKPKENMVYMEKNRKCYETEVRQTLFEGTRLQPSDLLDIKVTAFTDSAISSSPYYYLQQNDVLYVEPDDSKKKSENVDPNCNLAFQIGGGLAPNPTELLDLPRFGEMVEYFKDKYDYIIIDSAPMLMVSDTHNLIKHADAVMYVLRAGYTEKDVTEFIDQLSGDKAKNKIATVLNGVEEMHLSYGNKYGYGYGQEPVKRSFKDYFKL